MSHTTLDANADTQDLMVSALWSDDYEYVAQVAQHFAGLPGWEEEAQTLRDHARSLRDEAWGHDEMVERDL